MAGQRITDPNDMNMEIRTDRTKANSKQEAKNVFHQLDRLKEYGNEFLIKSDFSSGYSVYQSHTIKNGKPCKKQFSYFATSRTLSDLNGLLANITSMFQDRYIFEAKIVTNEKRFTWELVEIKSQ